MTKFRLRILQDSSLSGYIENHHEGDGVIDFCVFELEESDVMGKDVVSLQGLASIHALRHFNAELIGSFAPFYANVSRNLALQTTSVFEEISKEDFLGDHPKWDKGALDCPRRGFLYAYFSPPHGGLTYTEFAKANYNKIIEFLMNDFKDNLVFYKGPTDWSNYFDAGHEWWGAYHWQIWNKTQNRLIVMMASATD